MIDLLRDLREYANRILSEYDINAVTLQVCDRGLDTHRVLHLLDVNIPPEASWTYQSRSIFLEDPFTDVELNEEPDLVHSDRPILGMDKRIQNQRERSPRYWSFLDYHNLRVEGVSTRRLRRGVFTVAGFIRDNKRKHNKPLPQEALGRASTIFHNMMGAEVLRGTLSSNAGLIGLQRVLETPDQKETERKSVALSARELEVAKLVARGAQTKEVAFHLCLSEHTVENHLRRIYVKLGVKNRTALAHLLS